MGLLKGLFRVGLTAGTAVAAVKVAQKFKENNPNGVQDHNADGKIDAKDYIAEGVKAATDVYDDAAAAIRRRTAGSAQNPQDAPNNGFDPTL